MNDKKTRYIITIFTLDRIDQSTGITTWNKEDYFNFLKEKEKHYGLKLISVKEELLIVVEYTNIIWNYKIYFGTYKKKYHHLILEDERWIKIENQIKTDLKTMGLDELNEKVLSSLKKGKYFEYKTKVKKQFKKYCI